MGEKLDLVETSRALASIGLQEGDVYRRLHAAGLFDAESIGRLGYLARHMQPWSAEGDWGPERVPGVGLTWSDSPGGHYRDNARASLSRPLSLAGLEKSTLRFSRAFALESSDPVTLEVTRDGREWIPLKRFTGNSDWQTEEVDLSAYDGRLLQLRFRFSSDHSVTYDGFKFHNLELTGRQAGQPVTVGLQQSFAPADTAQVLELLKQDSKPRLEWLVRASERLGDGRAALDLGLDGDLEEAAALAADLGDARGGVALWKALRPLQDPAERRAFGELLVAMASEQGVDEALRLWARADLSGAGTASERAGLYQLARAVSPERAGELYGQLQKAGLYSAESQRELISLVRQVGTWKAGGSWGTERVPGRGTVWSDSPGKQYSDNRRDSLERRLSLQGLIGSRLRFTAKHELESSDHCYLEVSSDGKEWVSRADFTGTRDWSEQRVDLSAYDGRDVWVRFRFVSDHSVVYDGISLADIRLEGTSDGSAVSERVDGRFAEGDLARLIDTVAVPGAGPAMLSAYHEAVEVAGGAGEVLPVVSVLSKVAGATPEVREASVKSVAVLARVLGAEEALRAWPRYEQMAPPEMLRATLGLGVRERLGGDLPEAGVEDLEAVWQAVREKAPAAPVAERLLDLARGAERGRLFRNLALLDPKMRERVEQVICERPSLGTNVMANVVEILVFGGMLGEDPDQTLERALQQATTDTTIAVEEDQVWVGGHPVSVSS